MLLRNQKHANQLNSKTQTNRKLKRLTLNSLKNRTRPKEGDKKEVFLPIGVLLGRCHRVDRTGK